ncbi:hypothetical protein F4820DRAFT_347099 [Hypoxylon rubiginosum]|uniref:Uncharacterized protein n=1 Tax=Hypoxylon rubiginosum TaxID=110542 RepID=A0ACB9YZF2_9PEZI|nr:hypothetical protein F4820DRAFT_347099 [Hypoxylon rubiginosum]
MMIASVPSCPSLLHLKVPPIPHPLSRLYLCTEGFTSRSPTRLLLRRRGRCSVSLFLPIPAGEHVGLLSSYTTDRHVYAFWKLHGATTNETGPSNMYIQQQAPQIRRPPSRRMALPACIGWLNRPAQARASSSNHRLRIRSAEPDWEGRRKNCQCRGIAPGPDRRGPIPHATQLDQDGSNQRLVEASIDASLRGRINGVNGIDG